MTNKLLFFVTFLFALASIELLQAQCGTGEDTTPPSITCPSDITVDVVSTSGTCEASIAVPQPLISDNCSTFQPSSLNFDGSDDRVDVDNGFPAALTEATIEARILMESASGFDAILNYDGWDTSYLHFQLNNGSIGWSINSNSPVDHVVNPGLVIGQWYTISIVYSSTANTAQFYLDGTLIETRTYTTANPIIGGLSYNLGSWDVGRVFDGSIDEIRVWDILRTETEILSDYDKTLTGTETGLVALYTFDGAEPCGDNTSITTISDLAGGDNDGTIGSDFQLDASNGCQSNFSDPASDSEITLTNDFNGTIDASGTYSEGTTTVTWTATDAAGNSSICTMDVTLECVLDVCPADITVVNDPGLCEASVTVPQSTASFCAQSEDMESYALGTFQEVGQWATWTENTPSQLAEVSNEQFNSGGQSLKFEGVASGGPVDMIYKLGNRDSRAWELTYHLYIPAGNTAFTNIQKSETAGTQWAHQIQYKSDGTANYQVNDGLTPFTFSQDTWLEVKHLINIDANYCEFFINGESIISHDYSLGSGGLGGLTTIGALNFFPISNFFEDDPNPNATPLFYVDDISLCAVAVNDYNSTNDATDTYPVGTTDVVWTYTDSFGTSINCTQQITVNDSEVPPVVCQDITVQLDENGTASIVADDILPPFHYSVDQSGVFNPMDISVTGTEVTLGDDDISVALPIGFDFDFFGSTYTEFYISSNGFITFNNDASSPFEPDTIPDSEAPNNFIAPVWADLDPAGGGQPTENVIRYATEGTAPNRILIVEYFNVDQWPDDDNVTVQAQLYEGTNKIEIHTTTKPNNGSLCTQGIENADGSYGVVVPGRNQADDWSGTDDFVAFIPVVDWSSSSACGANTITLDQDTFDCSDFGANSVTLTLDNENGHSSSCTATVTVEDPIAPTVVCQDLTVELDITGNVTIDATNLLSEMSDNCGVDAVVARTPESALSTLFSSNNGGAPGGVVYFDLEVLSSTDIIITALEVNTVALGDLTVEIYASDQGTYSGNEFNDQTFWGDVLATATGTSMGENAASTVILDNPITLSAGTTYAMALVMDANHAHAYTNGDGTNTFYSNADLSLSLGSAAHIPFTDQLFESRIWNGSIVYAASDNGHLFLADTTIDFDISMIGDHELEVIATDSFGNASSCLTTVTVTSSTLSLEEPVAAMASLSISPNPASHQVLLNNPKQMALDALEIYDLTGRLIKSVGLEHMGTEQAIDVSQLPTALYLLRIKGENGAIRHITMVKA